MRKFSLLASAILVATCAPLAGCMNEGADVGGESDKTPLASGVLVVAIGGTHRSYSIRLQDGSYVPLDLSHLQQATPDAPESGIDWTAAGGTPVDVFGTKEANGTITVDALRMAEGLSDSADAVVTSGAMKVLVLNVTFNGGAALGTNAALTSSYGKAANHFAGSSFGKLNMTYDVVGPYNVSFKGCSDADYHQWITDAQNLAVSKGGKKLSNYTHFSLVGNYNCDGGSSWGQVPGNITWIHDIDPSYPIHELGHNLGLNHAHSRTCKGSNGAVVPMSGSCTVSEYGDPFDTMGDSWGGQYNAGYKAAIGWLPSANVKTITSSQTVTLAPVSATGSATQLINIPGPSPFTYQVEFRQPAETDKLASHPASASGVFIRAYSRQSGNGDSYLLDMNPGGNFNDAALAAGKSYPFYGTKATIKVNSISSSSAVVQVSGL